MVETERTLESVLIDRLDELHKKESRCNELEKAIREMWLLIEEHGGPAILAHATQLMRIHNLIEEIK
jgi:hypothetical protein